MTTTETLSPAGAAFERAVKKVGVPTRRNEAWRWSDLHAVLTPEVVHNLAKGVNENVDIEELQEETEIIGALAAGLSNGRAGGIAFGRRELGPGGSTAYQTVSAGHGLFIDVIDAKGGVAAHWHGLQVRAGAEVTRVVIQRGDGIVLYRTDTEVHPGARYRQFILTEGAKLARFETHVDLERENAHAEIDGVYMCGAGRHADLTSVIDHIAPNGTTRQLIKGVARKGGRGVFQGKIVVAHDAQKTDARQYHHGLLLDDGAEVFAKPELMIHADDVQCAHGNTAGGLDESALFYLRSRGVPEAAARAMLIEAFLVEAIPEALPAELQDELTGLIRTWLGAAQ